MRHKMNESNTVGAATPQVETGSLVAEALRRVNALVVETNILTERLASVNIRLLSRPGGETVEGPRDECPLGSANELLYAIDGLSWRLYKLACTLETTETL